jgi:hypothetical protein
MNDDIYKYLIHNSPVSNSWMANQSERITDKVMQKG